MCLQEIKGGVGQSARAGGSRERLLLLRTGTAPAATPAWPFWSDTVFSRNGRPSPNPSFDHEERIVVADVGGLRIASVYVPNGGKDYPAKLAFLEALTAWAA
jgi:exonuclease III